MHWFPVIILTFAVQMADSFESPVLNVNDPLDIMRAFGWNGEEHTVYTEDGYILKLYRLLSPDKDPKCRSPVLMMSGLGANLETWILQGPQRDLAFLLVNAGFDVWLGGVRGNSAGKGHIHLKKYNVAFWNFSWHEMGYYDVPALIDHILLQTGAQQVFYVGHSMGTTMFLVMCSTRPEYNAKVRQFIAMAPAAFVTAHGNAVVTTLSRHSLQIYLLSKSMYIRAKPFWMFAAQALGRVLCRRDSSTNDLCDLVVKSIMGKSTQFDPNLLPVILGHVYLGSPLTFKHYIQGVYSGRFQKVDLGRRENLRLYGSTTPPDYDLSAVTVPTSIYYSSSDIVVLEADVMELAKSLPHVIRVYSVPERFFNHIDFLWARDAYTLLYKDIIKLMTKYNYDMKFNSSLICGN